MKINETKKLKKSRKTILCAIYIITVSSCFTFLLYIIPQKNSIFIAQKYPIYNISVDLNVIDANPQNISRIYVFYQAWGKDFISMFPNSTYRILSTKDFSEYIPFYQQIDYIPSKEDYQNLIFGFTESLYNFCNNSTARWYMRMTEDAFIDIRKVPAFFEELEKKYDTNKDLVIKGQLCRVDEDLSFIHGGAGWVMSRAMAQLVQENMDELLTYFFNEMESGDDTFTYLIKKKWCIPDSMIHSESFLSTRLSDFSVKALQTKNFTGVKECPNFTDFTRGPLQLNKVVFWHSGRADNFPIDDAYDILNTVPDELKVVFIGTEAHLCLKK